MRLLPAVLLAAALALGTAGPAYAGGRDEDPTSTPAPTTQVTSTPGLLDECRQDDCTPPEPTEVEPTDTSTPVPTDTATETPTVDPTTPTETSPVDPTETPTDTTSPTATDTTSAEPTPVRYENCAEVRAAGHPFGLLNTEDGYRPELDRDGDGWACELGEGRRHHEHGADWRHFDGRCDSDPRDNDHRRIVLVIHRGHDGEDGEDGSDGRDGRDGRDGTDGVTITDSGTSSTYSQWNSVPTGGIATGAA